MLYFAYGSNLLPARLLARTPSARFVGAGVAPGWDLRFHKHGTDGSGKASLAAVADGEVPGALVELARDELPLLDRCEVGYRRVRIDVLGTDGWRRAVTYRALPERVRPGLRPWSWYRDLVVEGARANGLCPRWIGRLEATESVPDPVRDRERRMRRLL